MADVTSVSMRCGAFSSSADATRARTPWAKGLRDVMNAVAADASTTINAHPARVQGVQDVVVEDVLTGVTLRTGRRFGQARLSGVANYQAEQVSLQGLACFGGADLDGPGDVVRDVSYRECRRHDCILSSVTAKCLPACDRREVRARRRANREAGPPPS
nr:hypothetical protein [Streptomyces sp. C8S0]